MAGVDKGGGVARRVLTSTRSALQAAGVGEEANYGEHGVVGGVGQQPRLYRIAPQKRDIKNFFFIYGCVCVCVCVSNV